MADYISRHTGEEIDSGIDKVQEISSEIINIQTKLDTIDENANNYSLPAASSDTLGGIKSAGDISVSAEGIASLSNGSVGTQELAGKSVTRAKLADDALYSPIGWNTEITTANIGQTMRINWNAATTFRLTQTNSSTIDPGAEIAFLRWGAADIDVLVVGSGGIRFALPGETEFKTNATLKIPETFGMIALKKIENSSSGDTWLVTGNVEVVS